MRSYNTSFNYCGVGEYVNDDMHLCLFNERTKIKISLTNGYLVLLLFLPFAL